MFLISQPGFRWILMLTTSAVQMVGCSPNATPPTEAADLFCKEHGVPERFCFLCHEELKSTLEWCSEHGLPEAICTVCHPEAAAKLGITLLCKEHGLPEHFCKACNPAVAGDSLATDWCLDHGVPRSLCLRCSPELEKQISMCTAHGQARILCSICRPELAAQARPPEKILRKSAALPLVRMARPDVADKAGIEAAVVAERQFTPEIEGLGEIGFDETRFGIIRPRVSGVVLEALASPGDAVDRQQVLCVIDSAELGTLKADYLAALPMEDLWRKTLERKRGLLGQTIAAKEIEEAEAEWRRAEADKLRTEQKLLNCGLDQSQIDQLRVEPPLERNRLRLLSPLRGTVVRRKAAVGDAVDPTREVFAVADLSKVWAHVELRERESRRVRPGQRAGISPSGEPEAALEGKVLWIDAEANLATRMARATLEVSNSAGLLHVNTFVKARIQTGEPHAALLIPPESPQWEGLSFVVFVEREKGIYEPRRVILGDRSDGGFELAWGELKAGDRVVTTGSFLLRTEIQKGAIGAGCCGK